MFTFASKSHYKFSTALVAIVAGSAAATISCTTNEGCVNSPAPGVCIACDVNHGYVLHPVYDENNPDSGCCIPCPSNCSTCTGGVGTLTTYCTECDHGYEVCPAGEACCPVSSSTQLTTTAASTSTTDQVEEEPVTTTNSTSTTGFELVEEGESGVGVRGVSEESDAAAVLLLGDESSSCQKYVHDRCWSKYNYFPNFGMKKDIKYCVKGGQWACVACFTTNWKSCHKQFKNSHTDPSQKEYGCELGRDWMEISAASDCAIVPSANTLNDTETAPTETTTALFGKIKVDCSGYDACTNSCPDEPSGIENCIKYCYENCR